MVFTYPAPAIRIMVRNSFLSSDETGSTEAYLLSVTSIPNRPLFFTVHLETGAVWSQLPIHALWCKRFGVITEPHVLPLESCQPFSCLSGDIQVVEHPHLKNMDVLARLDGLDVDANYLFTVDVMGSGLADDPVQYKTHNVCVLASGHLIAYPNNYLLFCDEFFTVVNGWPKYKRSDKYHLAGG